MRRASIRQDLISQALRLRPELDAVREKLDSAPEELVSHAFPASDLRFRTRAIIGEQEGIDPEALRRFDEAAQDQRRVYLDAGGSGYDKVVSAGPDATLTDAEVTGLEAIIRFTARPAIQIKHGKFDVPATPWQNLENHRDAIEALARSVGRIQIEGLTDVPYGGTGFLVGKDVLMTNCHVARLFAVQGARGHWTFGEGLQPDVDFVDNPDADPPLDFLIQEVIGIHDRLDLALLRVAVDAANGATAPEPLTVRSKELTEEERRAIYVVGYPAPDPRNDPAVSRQIFGDTYYVKRLQPGVVLSGETPITQSPCSQNMRARDVMYHDASTLGGNSGSCVVDLETNQLIGLHNAGLYTKYNQAIALWTLTDDPLLGGADVNFV
jgi:Trypsin-like peptidase domain